MAAWMSAGHSERTTHSKRARDATDEIATVMSATHNAPSHCENCETTGEEGGISTKIFVGYESDVVMRFTMCEQHNHGQRPRAHCTSVERCRSSLWHYWSSRSARPLLKWSNGALL